MPSWTHLIRFVAVEDGLVHLGQLVHPTRDVGLDAFDETPIWAFEIEGDIYDGHPTENKLQVRELLSPIAPSTCPYIRCIGLNYKRHAEEAKMALPKEPALFTKPRTSIADPFPGTLRIPKFAQDETNDYEAELAVVIGKSARDVSPEEAPNYILGFTVSNDVSARAQQMQNPLPTFSKGLDSSCPLGPVLVAREAAGNPHNLSISTVLNGKTVQDANTSDMIFGIYELVAYLSQGTTLEPGSIVLTGTPKGIGYFRSPRVFLKDGDDLRINIERIGTLINKIQYE
ncbi:hypothetical protein N7530_001032 [Penicillium desertorum]|uniref:Fumarylacetoacetase-like C-terminal domain-containing protein n=1 Tax=Penicillium desertorum TaxID=1303715 RepID=A0A9W9X9C6_9EURO|nr:hypothetical protein N7530_001032 [Penicillium desertorum]